MKVYGIERITNKINKLELQEVVEQFEDINPEDIVRPEGVDVKIWSKMQKGMFKVLQ